MSEPGYYETDRAVSEYLLFHYGSAAQVLSWPSGPTDALEYPARCVAECLDARRLPPAARALDVGCAVGRSSFELARHCSQVVGIDYSQRFIEVARHLQSRGSLTYAYLEEGDLTTPTTAIVPREVDRGRVAFEQGDAHELRPTLGRFDVVLAANLVDRLREPRRFLEALPSMVNLDGQVILTTPCTWLEDHTPRQHWLGGFERNGHAIRTLATLHEILDPHFELAQTRDLPFLIREHARKYQWSVAQATVWRRR